MITFSGGLILGLIIGALVVTALALYIIWSPVRDLRERKRELELKLENVSNDGLSDLALLAKALLPFMKYVPRNQWLVASAWVCGDYSSVPTVQVLPHEPCEIEGAAWMTERTEVIKKLREICEAHGDNDWPDNLNLSDVLEKHLFDHLEDKELPADGGPDSE